jgi:hypothetical protein
MSASNRTQDKAAEQSGLENKSLAPVVEDKVAAKPEGVKVVLAHFVSAGYIDDEDHKPGDEVFVTAQVAHNLIGSGAAKAAD